jgi:hypothetical protein
MAIDFPTNTALLIVISMIGIGALCWSSLSQGFQQLPIAPGIRRGWRWGIAMVLIAWLVIRLGLAFFSLGRTVLSAPYVAGFFTVGMLLGLVPLFFSSIFRQAVAAIPLTRLVGLQAIRVIGVFFITLLDMKLLPAQFALPAGYGDVIVGLLAVWMVYLLNTKKPYARTLIILWNILGLLDLLIALTTGAAFIPAFANQVVASGGSVLYLNYVLLIPTYGVPLAVLFHIYTLFKLRVRQQAATSQPTVLEGSGLSR